MKHLWKKAESRKDVWWFSVLLNAAALLVLLLLMRPYFETNDDTTIYELASGAKGVTDYHLLFIHVIPGFILKGLTTLAPGLPWYTLMQYAVLFCSFTALSYVIFRRFRFPAACALFFTLYVFFAHQSFIVIQFSRTAGIASCAGILLMFHALEREKVNRPALIFGFLLSLAGGMYRYKEFLICAAAISGIGLYQVLRNLGRKSGASRKILLHNIAAFAFLFLCFFGLTAVDQAAYRGDWKEYRAWNDVRSNLLDYGLPDYETYRDEYEELGLSKADYQLFRSANHADPEVFTPAVCEKLSLLTIPKELNLTFVKNYLKRFPLGFFKIYVFTCFLLFCVYYLAWGKKGLYETLFLIYEILIIGGLYAYLYYAGRSLIARTETGVWLAACLCLLWLTDREKADIQPRSALAFAGCALAFNAGTWQTDLRIAERDTARSQREERDFLQAVNSDSDHLYLSKLGALSTYLAYGPFDAYAPGSTDNLLPLGGWEFGSPVVNSVLSSYNVTNPYREMINNPNVIVVDSDVEQTMSYLRAHYDPDVQAYEIKQIRERHFYSFRSEPFEVNTENALPADDSVYCEAEKTVSDDMLTIQGLLYRLGTNSFSQQIYLRITNPADGSEIYYPAMTYAGRGRTELTEGQYGGFLVQIDLTDIDRNPESIKKQIENENSELTLVLQTEDGTFLVPI